MKSNPSEYQRRSRFSCTSSSLTSSNEVSAPTLSAPRGSLNHHTSIGVPKLRGTNPIVVRSVDERPSQATVRSVCSCLVSPAASR